MRGRSPRRNYPLGVGDIDRLSMLPAASSVPSRIVNGDLPEREMRPKLVEIGATSEGLEGGKQVHTSPSGRAGLPL